MLIPVINLLALRDDLEIVVLALTTAAFVMKENNIPYIGYKDLVSLVDESWKQYGVELVGAQSESDVVPYEESLAYHGINYLDLISQYGQENAKNIYKEKQRQAFYPILFMKSVITSLAPELVVTTNSPRSERAAIDAAGLVGVDSICLVDMFALQEVEWVGKKSYAQKVCVLNEAVKKMFIDAGRLESELVVTGNPAFDSLKDKDNIVEGQHIRSKYELKPDQLVVLYASQPEPAVHPFTGESGDVNLPREIESVLREIASKNDKYKVVLRYHPSENEIFFPSENVYHSPSSECLHSLLHAVDIVVVTASTVGLEASILGKKVISIDNSIFTKDAPFSEMGVSHGISKPSQLQTALTDVCTLSLTNNNFKCTGIDAVSEVVNVIDSLLKLKSENRR